MRINQDKDRLKKITGILEEKVFCSYCKWYKHDYNDICRHPDNFKTDTTYSHTRKYTSKRQQQEPRFKNKGNKCVDYTRSKIWWLKNIF